MTLQPLFNYKLLFKSLFNKRKISNNLLLRSGRIAFSHILSVIKKKNQKINKIILPNLICEEIIIMSKIHKMNVSYYSIDEKLNFNIDEIKEISKEGNNIILFVNYFGFKLDWEQIKLIDNSNNFFIEDNAHVLSLNSQLCSFLLRVTDSNYLVRGDYVRTNKSPSLNNSNYPLM